MSTTSHRPETLAEMLKQAMERKGVNASEAAVQCGVSRQAYSLWLKEAYDPKLTPERLHAIAEFVGEDREDVLRVLGFLERGYLASLLETA